MTGPLSIFWRLWTKGAFPQIIRHGLVVLLDRMKAAVITPLEATIELCSGDMKLTAVRLAIDLKIFDTLAACKKASLSELAKPTNASKDLVFRLMRYMVAIGLAKSNGDDTFSPTSLAMTMVDGSALRDAVFHFSTTSRATVQLPAFLKSQDYREPDTATQAAWQFAYGTKEHYFHWINEHPNDLAAFNNLMSLSRLNIVEDWFDFYPVSERLVGVDAEEVLLVDIGGGIGHDVAAFKKAWPRLSGKLILQDLPDVIKEASISRKYLDDIEAQAHDFFNSQPVIGARVYYMRTVLHDWPDKEAKQILSNIGKAMDKDSILLLNENVLAEGSNISSFEARLDFNMMVLFSALERTEQQWKKLLGDSGFQTIQVYRPRLMTPGAGLVFEARL